MKAAQYVAPDARTRRTRGPIDTTRAPPLIRSRSSKVKDRGSVVVLPAGRAHHARLHAGHQIEASRTLRIRRLHQQLVWLYHKHRVKMEGSETLRPRWRQAARTEQETETLPALGGRSRPDARTRRSRNEDDALHCAGVRTSHTSMTWRQERRTMAITTT